MPGTGAAFDLNVSIRLGKVVEVDARADLIGEWCAGEPPAAIAIAAIDRPVSVVAARTRARVRCTLLRRRRRPVGS